MKWHIILKRTIAVAAVLHMSFAFPVSAFDIYLIRHFEKQDIKNGDKDVALTSTGMRRADQLVKLLAVESLDVIYSTDYKRTKSSVAPVSQSTKLPINLYDPTHLDDFALQLKGQQQHALVAGHSNTTGVLYALLGCEEVLLGHDDYGTVFVASINGDTVECRRFEVPE